MSSSPSSTQARIVVVGAGSIGGFVAFELARAGHDVTLCVRSPFERLVVIDEHGQRHERVLPILTDPADVAEADWVILATKAHQTEAAAQWLRNACGPSTQGVVVMQNGVEHEARVRPYVGAVPVLPCIVRCGAEAIAPGTSFITASLVSKCPAAPSRLPWVRCSQRRHSSSWPSTTSPRSRGRN
ncbi:MAG: hypothetical protein E6G39_04415 [Actinobacteria bacterium]|nr:MAG: hypothetical protein E6G39_04415 [Actinomycetota bacterium]